jgi:RimJ/RimL family protein N-acetyltransferase
MFFSNRPVQLQNDLVTLEALTLAHVPDLQSAIADGALWQLAFAHLPTPDKMQTYVQAALADPNACAFAVRDPATGRIVGSTRFYQIEPQHRRALIGYTWYAQSVQGTRINPACKLLLMTHLFEDQHAIAVELRTHVANQRSRAAMEKMGAKLDGVLRSHQIMPNGSLRDSAVYSIVASEWPQVREGLRARLLA